MAGDPKVQDEIILARQGLMEAVYELLDEGERPENDAELAAMHVNAEAVALSLPTLKHLFPADVQKKTDSSSEEATACRYCLRSCASADREQVQITGAQRASLAVKWLSGEIMR